MQRYKVFLERCFNNIIILIAPPYRIIPCKIHAMEVLYLPGNPATISSKIKDLGQWLCVPSFQMVCLYQTLLISVTIWLYLIK